MTGWSGSGILGELRARGLVHDTTDPAALERRLSTGPVTLYCGFDPTADSLHLGNLQQILLLRRFQLAGHRPIALAGGATGMIGDPGGKSEERPMLDRDVLDANLVAICAQLERFLDFEAGSGAALLVDNREWTEPLSVLEFLRDVGKHVTVNTMLAKESVRSRLERDAGISYTEFSYMLLQAHDFDVLHQRYGCELQVAGSDQWGNITAGIDLIRRRHGTHVHGLTSPLLLRADGQKFGKSEAGAIWLDGTKTSPYQLYQYLVRLDDADVERMLLRLTLLPVEEIDDVVKRHAERPEARLGQRTLATHLVELVHGPAAVGPVLEASDILFGGDPQRAAAEAFEVLGAEIPTTRVSHADLADPVSLLAGAFGVSKGEVRRQANGFYVNGRALQEWGEIDSTDLLHGRYLILRRGKSRHHLVQVG